ncbi:MAG: FkbM family methyltransferase [Thermoleophilaceae bacterium]|nr:FkbM family methyltransferase [Thermoleophilaceae bacterium]
MGVKGQVRSLLRARGYEISRSDPGSTPLGRKLRILERQGVNVVVDGGANEGQWARALRAGGYDGRLISLEPLAAPFARLSARASADPAWECRRVAVGSAGGEVEMNVAGNSGESSSLLAMQPRHEGVLPAASYVGTEKVEMVRLETVLGPLAESGAHIFLKLDLQGYELEALGGAGELAGVTLIECELSFVDLYAGAPHYLEVAAWLESRGFVLVGLEPSFIDEQQGHVLQSDGLFARNSAGTRR